MPGAEEKKARGVSGRILRASAVVMFAHVLIKVLGLLQNRFLGGAFGAGRELDVYVVAFEGVIWTVFLVGEEALGPAFLPLFMEGKDKGDEAGAWRFASTVMLLQAAFLAVVVAVIEIWPGRVIEVFTQWSPGGGGLAEDGVGLAGRMLRVMAPGLFGLSMASITYMLLNGYKKFFWAAFGDGTLKIAIILSVLVPGILGRVWPSLGAVHPLYVAVGVLAGSFGKLATHLPGLWSKLKLFRPRLDLRDPRFRKFVLLVAPLLVGIVYAKVRDVFNNYWVLSSLEAGFISLNSWGKKIYNTVGFILPYAVSIAMFPYFCELVDREDREGLGRVVTRSLRVLMFFLFPMAVGLVMVSVPLAKGLYQVGKFSAADAFMAGSANAVYTLALPFWAVEMVLMQAFFSDRRTVAPVAIGIVWSSVSMLVSYVGVVSWGLRGLAGLLCVAGGFAFARAAKALTLGVVLGRKVPLFREKGDLAYLAKLGGAVLVTGLSVWAAREAFEAVSGGLFGPGGPEGRTLTLVMLSEVAVCGAAGAAGLFAGGWMFRMEELRLAVSWTRERLRRGRR